MQTNSNTKMNRIEVYECWSSEDTMEGKQAAFFDSCNEDWKSKEKGHSVADFSGSQISGLHPLRRRCLNTS